MEGCCIPCAKKGEGSEHGSSQFCSASSFAITPARTVAVCFLVLFFVVVICNQWIDTAPFQQHNPTHIHFSCPTSRTFTCPKLSPPSKVNSKNNASSPICPDYFRWIHEDLRPWKDTGIAEDMLLRAKPLANFRLLVVNGTAYIEKYRKSFQTRDVFSMWGILQLLRRYPGRVPDLDLMFVCNDHPGVKADEYKTPDGGLKAPPALFGYCADDAALDIVFPDWSFWGWPEINIKPWEPLVKDLMEGNKRLKWVDRKPYAFWRGNSRLSANRRDLFKCNVSSEQDWNARLFNQDWIQESKTGYKQSNLAKQCDYRYKIYIEGRTWSVSEKYILACDSPALQIEPQYHDFFTRGLVPMQHYWPIRTNNKCGSIKFAVDWGNGHQKEAQDMGREGSQFIYEKLKMDHVYDYMFHLLNEYSKLLKFKPTVPPEAVEFCSESMACQEKGLRKKFMMASMVNFYQSSKPCTLPPAFTPEEMKTLKEKKANLRKQVVLLEQKAYGS